jgi:alkanesulfonate monooxygenase SsuD/methylene tetrahydromethanopterin reductase-like flavin-dependent oxidoreductase (luciferase family)
LSKRQWADAVKSVAAMWREDRFTWDSEFLHFPTPRPIVPKPVQVPHPPAWTAAVSDGSPAIAGKAGLGLLSFSILRPIDEMARHIREYRAAAMEPDPLTDITLNRVAAYTLVHCAESAARAEENGAWEGVWWWYQNHAELALEWDFPEMTQAERDAAFPLLKERAEGRFDVKDFGDHDMVIVGDVDQCVAKMKLYADAGADQLICYSEFGHLSHEAVMENLELIGTKILPVLKNYEPKRDRFVPRSGATPSASRTTLAPGGVTR